MTQFKPMQHQVKGLEIAKERNKFLYAWEPGTGKTCEGLLITDWLKWAGKPHKTVVVCPKTIGTVAWKGDLEKHFPHLTYAMANDGTPAKRRAALTSSVDVRIVNYETFRRVDYYTALMIHAKPDVLMVDESSKLRGANSDITKRTIAAAQQIERVYLFSGTPAPNGMWEYWGQLACFDPEVAAEGFWQWCHRHFTPIRVRMGRKEFIKSWRVRPEKEDEVVAALKKHVWSLKSDDCIDLPEEVDVFRWFDLNAKEKKAYAQMRGELHVALTSSRKVRAREMAVLNKLRQLACGFVIDTKQNETIEIGRSRLEVLLEIVEGFGTEPAIIWAEYHHDIDTIVAALRKIYGKNSTNFIDGRVSDKASVIEMFATNKTRFLVCHPMSVGHGVPNFVVARYAVYYNYGFSHEYHEQSRRRLFRLGQTRRVFHFYIGAKGTVDTAILRALKSKRDKSAVVLDAMRLEAPDAAVETIEEGLDDDAAGTRESVGTLFG